jgi:hypothetical protein
MSLEEERTRQKLRFARLHLDELSNRTPPPRGDDFERSHHEAFLAQLFGAYDAFLHELNVLLGCGLSQTDVALGKMRIAFKAKNSSPSRILYELYMLDKDSTCWFQQAKNFRDYIMHVSFIRLSFYMSGRIAFKEPQSGDELAYDVETTLSSWLSSMEQLIDRHRREATST